MANAKKRSLPIWLVFFAASCSGLKIGSTTSAIDLTARNEGMSLLYKLVSQEMNVDKILWVKSETDELQELIERIAATAKNAETKLRKMAEDDPTLELGLESLPEMEKRTRKAIESTKAKGLLSAKGKRFELELLLSQEDGLSYGSHMAQVLAEVEENKALKEYLTNLSTQLRMLHDSVVNLLEARTV